jgi:hypothetical protein
MKAILVKEFGGPDVCKLEENVPIPEPDDNQVILSFYCLTRLFLSFFFKITK